MASAPFRNWRNKSILEISDSEDELVESSFIFTPDVNDSDDDQVKSSFLVEPKECVIPSSDVDSDGSFNVNYRKTLINRISRSDDDDVDDYNDKNASSNKCLNVSTHEVDTLVSDAEQNLLSNIDDLKILDSNALEGVKKEERPCSSFSENVPLNDNSFRCEENYSDTSCHETDIQSAILESLKNSSATFQEVEINPSPKFNLQKNENNIANNSDVNNDTVKNKLSGSCSETLPLDSSHSELGAYNRSILDVNSDTHTKELNGSNSETLPLNSSSHFEVDDYNRFLLDHHTQSAILESLNEDKHISPMQFRFEENQISNVDSVLENAAENTDNDALLAEKLRLEYEIDDVTASVKNKKSTLNSVNLNMLPDKGLKLKVSLGREERQLETLFEQLNRVKSKMKSSSASNVKKAAVLDETSFKLSSLPSANLQGMGEKALENHRVEQVLTVESLKALHNSLKKCPSDDKTAADPVGLKVPLMNHQKQALAWLVWREKEKPSGGILADDMGLGKTLTMISLILKQNRSEGDNSGEDDDDFIIETKSKYKGGTLIICPSSLIGQWESEIRQRVRSGLLTYEIHHGPKREKKARRLRRFDIVITSYNIVRVESENFSGGGGGELGPLFQIHWKRIVLDEAHTIRNHQSLTAKAIFMLKGIHRWALTGTPIHNKTQDFFALIKFLRCRPFDDINVWKKWVEAKDETGEKRLNMLTKSLMLRRTKQLLMSEGKLQSLPEKSSETILVQLSKEEWALYEEVANFSKTLLAQLLYQRAEKQELLTTGIPVSKEKHKAFEDENPFVKHPALNKLYNRVINMQNVKTHEILVLLLRLRQICCHPALIKSMVEKEAFLQDGIVDEAGSHLDLLEQMSSMTLNDNQNDSTEDDKNTLDCSQIFNLNNRIFDPEWPSSKIQAVLRLLEGTLLKTDDRIVIVSQWTSMLELIGNFLKKIENCKFESLTGKVPVDKRMDVVSEFNSNSSTIRVLLLSLTAGGTGLNLVGGNHLILTDLHWNPQQEAQACDRIYRMGQTKPVKIYKFFCAETIEERIQKLQISKLALAEGVLTGAKHVQVGKLSLNDLKMLFNVN